MENLPAVGNLSLLHECAPTGVKDGHMYGKCQRCWEPGKQLRLMKGVQKKYCQECLDKRDAENRRAKNEREKEKKRKAEAEAERLRKAEAEAERRRKLQEAAEEKERKAADKERKRVWRENAAKAKAKRDKEKEAEGKIRGQMGNFADRVDLEPEEWAAFFGAGPAQMGKDDAEKPKNLDVLLEEEDGFTEKDSDLIKHYTADRDEAAVQADRKKCCTHDGKGR